MLASTVQFSNYGRDYLHGSVLSRYLGVHRDAGPFRSPIRNSRYVSDPSWRYRPLRTQQRAEGLHILQNRSTHKAVLAI